MDMKFIAQELVGDHVSALSGFIGAGGPSWCCMLSLSKRYLVIVGQLPFGSVWLIIALWHNARLFCDRLIWVSSINSSVSTHNYMSVTYNIPKGIN